MENEKTQKFLPMSQVTSICFSSFILSFSLIPSSNCLYLLMSVLSSSSLFSSSFSEFEAKTASDPAEKIKFFKIHQKSENNFSSLIEERQNNFQF